MSDVIADSLDTRGGKSAVSYYIFKWDPEHSLI